MALIPFSPNQQRVRRHGGRSRVFRKGLRPARTEMSSCCTRLACTRILARKRVTSPRTSATRLNVRVSRCNRSQDARPSKRPAKNARLLGTCRGGMGECRRRIGLHRLTFRQRFARKRTPRRLTPHQLPKVAICRVISRLKSVSRSAFSSSNPPVSPHLL